MRPTPADLADQWMGREGLQQSLEMRADLGSIGHEAALLDDVEVLHGDGGRDRMAARRVAVAEGAEPVRPVRDPLVDLVAEQHRGERHVGRGELLRDHQDIRRDAVMIAGEQRAEPAEPVDHLVGHHEHVVLAADRLDLLPIGGGRHDDAAGADQRLADEGRHGFGPLFEDLGLEFGGAAVRKGFLGLAGLGETVEVRAADMLHLRQGQVEAAVVGRQSR